MQSYNKNFMVNYQLRFEMGVTNSEMTQCQFGTSGNMYLGINSKATDLSMNYDKIYIY